MVSDLWLTISSDGQMTGQEMLKELQEYQIAPVMTFVQDGKTVVPLFKNKNVAERFAKRNTPREYTIGTMLVAEKDMAIFKEKGFETVILEFPNKRNIVIEVVELDREVQTHNAGWRRSIGRDRTGTAVPLDE